MSGKFRTTELAILLSYRHLLLAALLVAGIQAFEYELTHTTRKIRKEEIHPDVQKDGDCNNFCVFNDKTN